MKAKKNERIWKERKKTKEMEEYEGYTYRRAKEKEEDKGVRMAKRMEDDGKRRQRDGRWQPGWKKMEV